MAGDAQDKPISGEDVESAVKTLMDDDPFGQGDVPAARYLDKEPGTMEGHVFTCDSVRVLGQGLFHQLAQDNHLLLARQMGGSGGSHIDLAGAEAQGGPNFLDQLLARLDTRDNDNDHLPHDQDVCGGEYLL